MNLILLSIMILVSGVQSELFSLGLDYQISTIKSTNQLAHIRNQKLYRQTGWNRIYIYTNPNVTPLQQHRAAGFLQGYATYSQIHAAYNNFIKLDFEGQPYAPEDIQKFLDDQLQYMDFMVKTRTDDIFWVYVGYYLEQARYMHAGYQARIKREGKPELSLQFKMIYYLSSVGDLEDFIHFSPDDESVIRKNCNIYLRLDGNQLYTTHGTHNRYSFLLRTYKFWSFPRQNVPMQFTSFTSRPGDMISKDDFFILGSGLRVLETSLQNKNPDNINEVIPQTVPSWLRTLVANHLAHNASEWIQYFLKWRSGTHNNQWVLIDPSKISQSQGLVVFFEQAFSLSKVIDMTKSLKEKGYVGSYNTPITAQIYNKLGHHQPKDQTYQQALRGKILERYHPKMTNLQQMKYWLVQNDEELPKLGLAPRWDLLSTPKPFGMTDCKVSSQSTIRKNFFWAKSGPPTSNGKFAPFDWRKWADPLTPRQGLVDEYDFQWYPIIMDLQKEQNQLPKKQISIE